MKEREKKKTRNWYFLLWWPCNFYADAESSESVEYSSYVLSKTFLLHCSAITDCMKNRLKTTLENRRALLAQPASSLQEEKKMKKGKTLSMLTVLSKLKTSFWSDVSSVVDQSKVWYRASFFQLKTWIRPLFLKHNGRGSRSVPRFPIWRPRK